MAGASFANMSDKPKTEQLGESPDREPWADCDYFCINNYAVTGVARCGWHGRLRDIKPDATGRKLLCPRCGGATLFRIPLGQLP